MTDRERTAALATAAPMDGVARLAAELLDAPVAVVSILSASREWFIGQVGLGDAGRDEHGPGVPLDVSLCSLVLERGDTVVLHDLDTEGLGDHPARTVVGLRAYAAAPVRDEAGEIVGAVCAADRERRRWTRAHRDTLEALARHVERELGRVEEARAATGRAQELSLVLGTLRHELGSELSVVLGGIDTALHPRVPDDVRDQVLDRARAEAARVIGTLDALLRADRRHAVRLQRVAVRRLLDDVREGLPEDRTPRLLVDAPDVEVVTGRALLHRIVSNLVDNALKYSRDEVRVTVRDTGDGVELEVADRGPGMPRTARDQLFEPFSAGHAPEDEGFGLGLFIVRELSDRLGASIDVDTGPDGTRITVAVPSTPQSPKPSNAASSSDGA